MKIKINNREKIMPDGISLNEMMKILNYNDISSFAIAINEDIIPKAEWEKRKVLNGDNITIIQATCGG